MPARLRIVGWILLTAALGMTGLVVTVHSAMQAATAHQANQEVVQELGEFRQFVAEGRDPLTAQPFTDTERVFEVYLTRQRPDDYELLVARADGGRVQTAAGSAVEGSEFDLTADPAWVARVLDEPSGLATSPAGEIRWSRDAVVGADGRTGRLAVVVLVDPLNAAVTRTTQLMVLIGLGVLVIIAVMAWFVAGQILRPARAVREAAADITQNDLSRRIPVTGKDDIAELAVQFNAMLDRLQAAFTAEQDFVAQASQELRVLLGSIRSRLSATETGGSAADLAYLFGELDRVERALTDLETLASADTPGFLTADAALALPEFAARMETDVRPLGARDWRLARVPHTWVTIDATRVLEAIRLLAQNAVEHTYPGGRIEIACRIFRDDDGTRMLDVSVTDDGEGITGDVATLFDTFTRAAAPDGLHRAGLGLAVVKAIAQAHGGWAYVDSAPGRGATVGITLTVGEADDAEARAEARPSSPKGEVLA